MYLPIGMYLRDICMYFLYMAGKFAIARTFSRVPQSILLIHNIP